MPECVDKVKTGMIAGFVFGFSQFAIFLSFAIIFYVGTNMLVNMELYFADFFTALLSVMFGALGASQVSADFNNRARGMTSAARLVFLWMQKDRFPALFNPDKNIWTVPFHQDLIGFERTIGWKRRRRKGFPAHQWKSRVQISSICFPFTTKPIDLY
jgi:hypothetical protein